MGNSGGLKRVSICSEHRDGDRGKGSASTGGKISLGDLLRHLISVQCHNIHNHDIMLLVRNLTSHARVHYVVYRCVRALILNCRACLQYGGWQDSSKSL